MLRTELSTCSSTDRSINLWWILYTNQSKLWIPFQWINLLLFHGEVRAVSTNKPVWMLLLCIMWLKAKEEIALWTHKITTKVTCKVEVASLPVSLTWLSSNKLRSLFQKWIKLWLIIALILQKVVKQELLIMFRLTTEETISNNRLTISLLKTVSHSILPTWVGKSPKTFWPRLFNRDRELLLYMCLFWFQLIINSKNQIISTLRIESMRTSSSRTSVTTGQFSWMNTLETRKSCRRR